MAIAMREGASSGSYAGRDEETGMFNMQVGESCSLCDITCTVWRFPVLVSVN
jgi:hypothetical protein